MWLKESIKYCCKNENFAYGETDEQSYSKPHPLSGTYPWAKLG